MNALRTLLVAALVSCAALAQAQTLGPASTVPGGSTTQLQYNNGGAFGGVSGWTTNGSTTLTGGASTTLAVNGCTIGTNTLCTTGPLSIDGNTSVAAWTTSGVRLRVPSGTLTDTSSSGTVAAAYTSLVAGSTIAASSATTFTQYYGAYFTAPVASTNVTMTNKSALGADTLSVGGAAQSTDALAVTGSIKGSTTITAGSNVVATNAFVTGGGSNFFGSTLQFFIGTKFVGGASDGLVLVQNNAGNDFGRIMFGGSTSSFPALKRSTTSLQVRLADDSAFGVIQGKLTTDTNYTAGVVVPAGYLTIYDAAGTAYKVSACTGC